MKKRSFITALALVLVFFGLNSASAQSAPIKIGYTNVDYILSQLPEAKQIEKQLKEYETQLGNQLKAKMSEFETKYKDFNAKAETMLPEVRNDKQQELQQMQQQIQQFQQTAQGSLQKKQQELLAPTYKKIQNAIDKVAKANGYTHVFTSDAAGFPVLLYARDEDNISNLVLKDMGVTATTPAPSKN
ncbi:OmpH family outer membrane protein [Persicobacter psychrovividus]|uniref:OmpH family outer membrane protein n=1 Tax=Persicobacter psychrovividus TaxID=387638 RepID=A0ABM7VAT6_9BACT|nr:hypothetical protein PEPS_03060 [Persicobacter psychrovividus]